MKPSTTDLSSLLSAPAGKLSLLCEQTGCFDGERLAVRLFWTPSGAVLRTPDMDATLDRAALFALLQQVIAAAALPPPNPMIVSTAVHSASLTWSATSEEGGERRDCGEPHEKREHGRLPFMIGIRNALGRTWLALPLGLRGGGGGHFGDGRRGARSEAVADQTVSIFPAMLPPVCHRRHVCAACRARSTPVQTGYLGDRVVREPGCRSASPAP